MAPLSVQPGVTDGDRTSLQISVSLQPWGRPAWGSAPGLRTSEAAPNVGSMTVPTWWTGSPGSDSLEVTQIVSGTGDLTPGLPALGQVLSPLHRSCTRAGERAEVQVGTGPAGRRAAGVSVLIGLRVSHRRLFPALPVAGV